MMFCANKKSFLLYYYRVKVNNAEWTKIITEKIFSIGGVASENDIKNISDYDNSVQSRWKTFEKTVNQYLEFYSQIPTNKIILRKLNFSFIHCLILTTHSGLGP